jgi:hypothetical protein
MAVHILKPNLMRLKEASSSSEQKQSIEERVTQVKAEEYLAYWKKLKIENNVSDEEEQQESEKVHTMKGQLFIKFGEDASDIFEAFAHYGLSTSVSDEDRHTIQ